MTPFGVYKKYCGLRAHFSNSGYDFIKFKGNHKASQETFDKRPDKYFFHRVAKTFKNSDVVPFLLANIVDSADTQWIGNMDLSSQSHTTFIQWKKKLESLTYVFGNDIDYIFRKAHQQSISYDDLFKCSGGNHPIILKLLIGKAIHLETFIILNEIIGFFDYFDKKLKNDLAWDELKHKSNRYRKFFSANVTEYQTILKTHINNCTLDNDILI